MKTTWQITNSETKNNNSKIKQNVILKINYINKRLCQKPEVVANAQNHCLSQVGN